MQTEARYHRLQFLFLTITLAILATAIFVVLWQDRGQREVAARIDTHRQIAFHSGKIRQELMQIHAQMQRRLPHAQSVDGEAVAAADDLYGLTFNLAISLYTIRSQFDSMVRLFGRIEAEHELLEKLESLLDRLDEARPLLDSTLPDSIGRANRLIQGVALTTEQLEGLHTLRQRELRQILDTNTSRDNRFLIGLLLILALLGYVLTRWAFNLVRTIQDRFTAELEDRNAELERFVYTVSHDLRTPLVSIKGFVGFLHRDLDTHDDEKVRNDLIRIDHAADTMGDLLDGLLELSRVGRVINPPEAGSLDQLVYESIEPLREQLRQRGIHLEIQQDMPDYWGDQLRLIEVFQNLVENAIKFMGEQPAPRIEISARREGDEIRCSVRDNGIGIEPRYQDRIFDLFERMHPEIEGTGIGTTLVKRIIEAHGGSIWVESAGQNQGCAFVFTLPSAPSAGSNPAG